jgi:hypothetical protein
MGVCKSPSAIQEVENLNAVSEEQRGAMKRPTTQVPGVGTKDPTAPKLGAGMKDPAAATSVAVDFTVAPPSVGLQNRTPKLARIPARLEGTTTVAPRAATGIAVTRACTAAAFMKVVFTQVAVAAAVD